MDSPARRPRASLSQLTQLPPVSPAPSRPSQDRNFVDMQEPPSRAAGAGSDAAGDDSDLSLIHI
eukprot:12628606-Alexandrium_andersonii.AAC.1